MLPHQLHTTFGSPHDLEKERNPKEGRRTHPAHLLDHVWHSIDGWVDAETAATQNRLTAERHRKDGIPHIFPANPKRRGISAVVRGGCSGNADEPFNHVPGEDPAKWEKAHHFKRFASRPELFRDSVWACTGYANAGLPEALQKLLPAANALSAARRNHLHFNHHQDGGEGSYDQENNHNNNALLGAGIRSRSSTNFQRSNIARDQLVADGLLPAALPAYRKLWGFQKREVALGKRFGLSSSSSTPTPPSLQLQQQQQQQPCVTGTNSNVLVPRPPLRQEKNRNVKVSSSSNHNNNTCQHNNNNQNHEQLSAPRDNCVAGCCPSCGTNLKPWNGFPANCQFQPPRPISAVNRESSRSHFPEHYSQHLSGKKSIHRNDDDGNNKENGTSVPRHHGNIGIVTLPRSHLVIKTEKLQTTNQSVYTGELSSGRAASAGIRRK